MPFTINEVVSLNELVSIAALNVTCIVVAGETFKALFAGVTPVTVVGGITVKKIDPVPIRACASLTVKGKDFDPVVVAGVTVAENEKILSPAVTSPWVMSS